MRSARFGAAVAGLVLNFVPKPSLVVREMARTVQPGGVVTAYVWDYAGRMELIRYFWDDSRARFGRAKLPIASDGAIDLIARSWAVRGQTP